MRSLLHAISHICKQSTSNTLLKGGFLSFKLIQSGIERVAVFHVMQACKTYTMLDFVKQEVMKLQIVCIRADIEKQVSREACSPVRRMLNPHP